MTNKEILNNFIELNYPILVGVLSTRSKNRVTKISFDFHLPSKALRSSSASLSTFTPPLLSFLISSFFFSAAFLSVVLFAPVGPAAAFGLALAASVG